MSGRRAKRERRSKRSEPGRRWEISLPFHGEPDLVRFYIPLPDPLKLADGTQLPVRYVWNPIADDGPCFLLPPEGNIKYAARQIAIFHQDEVSMDVEQFAAAMKIMALALERSGSSERVVPAQGEPRLPIAHTTVEMVCVLDPSQPDPVDHALEQAIDVIAEFQTYYHLSTKIPTRRLTRKALPRGIPIIFRPFNTPDKWESAILEINDWSTTVLAAVAPTMSAEQLQGLLEHNQAARAEVFKAFVLMRQEAVLAHTAGSTSAASLFVAIAAETLLTELFLLLSWEENASLMHTAAVLGERDNISKRLLNELASKLKGDWDRNGNGPLGEWQHQIASLRNEVAHAGTLPSDHEIDAALNGS